MPVRIKTLVNNQLTGAAQRLVVQLQGVLVAQANTSVPTDATTTPAAWELAPPAYESSAGSRLAAIKDNHHAHAWLIGNDFRIGIFMEGYM
jgi:hypothetical protein